MSTVFIILFIMLYFKNSDIAKKYHVSLGTVRNWIEAAQSNKLELTLHNSGSRAYIANTSANIAKIEELIEDGRKYRNKRAVKKIYPKPSFYEVYTIEQIYDIATNLETNSEVPLQYGYFDEGAHLWDKYVTGLSSDKIENAFNATQELLRLSTNYLNSILADYDRVNIIDIGPGNGEPVKWVIEYLIDSHKMGRYIAIDISAEMLNIARKNIQTWFGNTVTFEGYERNVNHDRFADLLIPDYFVKGDKKVINIVLHLGHTLRNMQRPENGYRTIYDSIGRDDLLIEDNLLDTESSRAHFDYNISENNSKLFPMNALFIDRLNLDESYFEQELGFDKDLKERFVRIRLNVAIEICIEHEGRTRTIHFNKGDRILLQRNIHLDTSSLIEQREKSGFSMLYSNQTNSQEYMLSVFRVKKIPK